MIKLFTGNVYGLFTAASPNNRCLPGNTNNNNLNLSGLNGTFESPRDPHHSQYYPGMSCDWLITVPEGNIVKLSFELFDMESVSAGFPLWRCYGDYVEVLEGNRCDSKAKGNLCGESNPGIIRSRSRYMLVRFRSDSSHSRYRYHKGFKADFTAENKLSKSISVQLWKLSHCGWRRLVFLFCLVNIRYLLSWVENFSSKHLIFFLNEVYFLRENSLHLPYFQIDGRVIFSSL